MKNGLDQIANRRARAAVRSIPRPRNPVAAADAAVDAVPEVSVAANPPASPGGTAPAAPESDVGAAAAAESEAAVLAPAAPVEPKGAAPQQAAAAAAAPVRAARPPAARTRSIDPASELRTPPDLTIDWTDPLMHVVRPNRILMAVSVEARFKAAAAAPGAPTNTELVMAALSEHLAELPDLVLARRPEEQTAAGGFYVRRAPVSRTEPATPLNLRPNAGEWDALARIVAWVSEVITAGHPGRRPATRSEVITAALDAKYPPAE